MARLHAGGVPGPDRLDQAKRADGGGVAGVPSAARGADQPGDRAGAFVVDKTVERYHHPAYQKLGSRYRRVVLAVRRTVRENGRENPRDLPLVTGQDGPARWRQAHAAAMAPLLKRRKPDHDKYALPAGAVLRPASSRGPPSLASGDRLRHAGPAAMTGTCTQPAPPEAHSGMLRRGWVGVAQLVAVAVILIGAAAAIYGERATLRQGLDFFPHLRGGWVLAAAGAEFLSMMAFGQLERVLLQAAGARLTLRSVLATASNANAIAISVPVAGSGIATAYAIRDFRRAGADVGQASVVLTLAGVLSTVTFAILAALGAALSGNTAAALLGLAGSVACAGVAVALVMSLRFPRFRARLVTLADQVVRIVRRVTRGRPRRDVAAQISSALERAGDLRLSSLALAQAFAYAMVNWVADICCLSCAVHAVGVALPVTKILLIWSAGAGAASLSPVPGGIGIVDIVLIAAFAGAGVPTAAAVAATLLYRLLSFKICGTMAWFAYHAWQRRRAAAAPALASAAPPSSRRPTQLPTQQETVT